jgi:hypothetical protein
VVGVIGVIGARRGCLIAAARPYKSHHAARRQRHRGAEDRQQRRPEDLLKEREPLGAHGAIGVTPEALCERPAVAAPSFRGRSNLVHEQRYGARRENHQDRAGDDDLPEVPPQLQAKIEYVVPPAVELLDGMQQLGARLVRLNGELFASIAHVMRSFSRFKSDAMRFVVSAMGGFGSSL